ncbi:alpha/beta hydrolase [Iodidimonas muriae]|nr:alpha/beta hydrolase [Iodidimonas muriae]
MTMRKGKNHQDDDPWGLYGMMDRLGLGDSPSGDMADGSTDWTGKLGLSGLTVRALRSLGRGAAGLLEAENIPVAETRMLSVPDGNRSIPVRLYRGLGATADAPLVVYFHGGGFVAGSIDTHDGLTRRLANAGKAVVLSVDYRLAPEHPWPAALEDAMAVALRARHRARAHGANPERLILAGDSAGGTIAAVLARLLAETGKSPAGQMLFYPATDLTRARLFREMRGGLGALERRGIDAFRQMVVGADGDLSDPNFSPLFAPDFSILPPSYILAAGRDPLKEEVDDYRDRLKAAGVPVHYKCWPKQPHGFLGFGRVMKDVVPALDHAGQWMAGIC